MLLLYPSAFRDDFGFEMTQVFRDSCFQATKDGLDQLLAFWIRVLVDLIRSSLKEHQREIVRSVEDESLGRVVIISATVVLVFTFHLLWFGFGPAFVHREPLPAITSLVDLIVITGIGAVVLSLTCFRLLRNVPANLASIVSTGPVRNHESR